MPGCSPSWLGGRAWGGQGPRGAAGITRPGFGRQVTECGPLPCSLPAALDSALLHSIETTIIDWSHQIRDVLNKDSAQPLLDGSNPLPRVEFDFWRTRLRNLGCIHEQVVPPAPPRPGATSPPCPGAPCSPSVLPPAALHARDHDHRRAEEGEELLLAGAQGCFQGRQCR